MKKSISLLLLVFLLLIGSTVTAQEEQAVVRAVLFYSPTCPHCHEVMEEVLPPLVEQYGERLYIMTIDTTKEGGGRVYQSMVSSYAVPRERLGVPALVVGEQLLVGSLEIPQRFPTLIESGLAAGGVLWPDIPGFDPVAAEALFVVEEEEAAEAASPVELATASERVAEGSSAVAAEPDPIALILAALATLLMLGALGYVAANLRGLHFRLQQLQRGPVTSLLVPGLLLVGLIVAFYLSYVELTEAAPVCGPVGNCNLVQSSPYATIAGVPVAVLGIVNYLLIGALWLGQRTLRGARLRMATATMLALTVAGTLFSVYLTLLELFVIEAVCAWCLTSAAVTTLLMLLVTALILERVPAPDTETARLGFP